MLPPVLQVHALHAAFERRWAGFWPSHLADASAAHRACPLTARPPSPLITQEFDVQGLMRKRVAAINEAPIAENERRVAVEGGGPPVLNTWLAEQVGGWVAGGRVGGWVGGWC